VSGDDAPVGGEIFSSDGERLGKIWDVEDAAFQVDCADQADYWLPFNTVESADTGRIVLTFPKRDLDHYKRTAPLAPGRWQGLLTR
jgi:hypothetical protein